MFTAADTKSVSAITTRHADDFRTHGCRCTRLGFTLVELTIVLLLMATMAVVAVPRWTASLQKLRVSNAANRIVADFARVQSAAYNSSSTKTMTFTIDSSQYTVAGVQSLNNNAGPYIVTLSADPFQCRLVSVWGLTGNQSMTFNGYGVPNRGGNIIVAAGSYQKTIVVDAASGTAVVQ